MNYVPRRKDGSNVIRDKNGIAIMVKPEFEGIEIPFVFKGGKAFRADIKDKKRPQVPRAHFSGMRKQALAIHLKSTGKEPIYKRSIHSQRWEGTERERLEVLSNLWSYVMPDGSLTIIRMDIDPETGIEREVEMPYPDIDSAIRAQEHTLEGYFGQGKPGETNRLQMNREVLGEALDLFLGWRMIRQKNPAEQGRALTRIRLELQHVRNPFKVAARKQIGKVAKMKDSLGRPNPGALAARTTSAGENLGKRQKQIGSIATFAAARKHALFFERKQIELNIASAIFRLNAILRSSDKFFKNKQAFSERLNGVLYFLQSMWVEPFFTPVKEAHEKLLSAKTQNPSEARKTIQTVIEVLEAILKAKPNLTERKHGTR